MARISVASHGLTSGNNSVVASVEGVLGGTGEGVPSAAFHGRDGCNLGNLAGLNLEGALPVNVVVGLGAGLGLATANLGSMRVVGLVALIGVDLDAVLVNNILDVVDDIVLNINNALLGSYAVVDAEGGDLGHGVDLDATGDKVDSLRGLDEEVAHQVHGGKLVSNTLQIVLANELGNLGVLLGRVAGHASHVAVYGVLLGKRGLVGVGLELGDNLGDDANAGVGEGDGAVSADNVQLKPDIDVSLLHNAGQDVGDIVDVLHAKATFVEDDSNAIIAIALGQDGGDFLGTTVARALLVKAKREDESAAGLPVGVLQHCLNSRHEGCQAVLVVRGATAPEEFAIKVAAEGRVSPGRLVRDGNDVLVGHEHSRLQRGVGAFDCVEEAVGVDLFQLGVLVAFCC